MADTIEKRVADLEYILSHLPEDLDARFAGVDTKLAAIREVLALHTTRFSKLEARLAELAGNVVKQGTAVEEKLAAVDDKLSEILKRLPAPPLQ
jgi:oligoendopeptidase F